MPKKAANNKKSKAVKAVAPVKKTPAKKPVARKAAAKAPAPKQPAKKVAKVVKVAAPQPAKKAAKPAPKAVVAKKPAPGKAVGTKRIFGKPPFPIKGNRTVAPDLGDALIKPGKNRNLGAKFLAQQKKKLIDLREHMVNQMQGVASSNLHAAGDDSQVSAFGMHQADAGSDAYEKDFALSILSQEQDALYEINAAIKRIDSGTYGLCEMSGQPIPVNRLEAIPFARFTIECQSHLERENKGKHRWESSAQFMDSVETVYEEEENPEDSEEDPDKLKE